VTPGLFGADVTNKYRQARPNLIIYLFEVILTESWMPDVVS
jgi:hypothetical protein